MPSPPTHRRALSVLQDTHHTLPPLKRSSSVSNTPPPPPVEIGSTGSIFALLHRDISTRSSPAPLHLHHTSSSSKTFYVWHNRLWLFPDKKQQQQQPSYHHSLVPNSRPPQPSSSASSSSSSSSSAQQQPSTRKISKWKKLLNKLTGKNKAIKTKRSTTVINNQTTNSAQPNHNRTTNSNSPAAAANQTSPIWERRNFAQITPLNLSHLNTARSRHQYATTNNRPR